MQYYDHVTTDEPKGWPRCSQVEMQGEYLACVLDWERRYDLADNRAQRHIRFLNLETDQDLVGFVRAWGPLWLAGSKEERQGAFPRSQYWAFQAKLTAEVKLVQSFNSGGKATLQTALLEYIAADDGWNAVLLSLSTFTASTLGSIFAGSMDLKPEDWIPEADILRLRESVAWCFGTFHLAFTLNAASPRGKPHLAWKPRIKTLADAIQWESWNTFTGARPLTICEECRTAFQPESAHPRKFCSYRCAHRTAMRKWRKDNAVGQPKRKRGKHAKTKEA
jgi:hypothetical protein